MNLGFFLLTIVNFMKNLNYLYFVIMVENQLNLNIIEQQYRINLRTNKYNGGIAL